MHPDLTHKNHLNDHNTQSVASQLNDTKAINVLRRWISAAVLRWQRRRMMHALDRLDDRILTDIGLSRSDFADLVKGLDPHELRMTPVASMRTVKDVNDYKTHYTA